MRAIHRLAQGTVLSLLGLGSAACTLHFGNGYDVTPCNQTNIASNSVTCRWRTENVLVTRNRFDLSKANIGCSGNTCGHNALLSNVGTAPGWSPYLGTAIQEAVTLERNNAFRDNDYFGDWTFVAYEPGRDVDWATWRNAPYNQDTGSQLTR